MSQSTLPSPPASPRSVAATLDTLRHRFLSGRLTRSVLVVSSGHIAGYVLLAVTMPLLTRLYDPASFGVLASYASLMSLLGTGICGRYEAAIPLPASTRDAQQLAWGAISVAAIASLTASLTTWLLFAAIPDHWEIVAVRPYLWLLSLNLLFYGLFQVLTFSMTREKDFRGLAALRCYLVALTVLPQLAWGLVSPTATGLIAGQFTGYGIAALLVLPRRSEGFGRIPRLASVVGILRRYWRFPAFATLSELLNISLTVLPPLLLTGLYGIETAGAFLLAWRMVGAPITLLVVPIARIYCSEASSYVRGNGEMLAPLFRRTLTKCAVVAMGPMLTLAIAAPRLFPWLFGDRWADAGIYCTCLAPTLFCHLLAISVRSTFAATDRQDLQLVTSAGGTLLAIGTLVGAWWLDQSPLVAIAAFGLAASISYLVLVAGCNLAIRSWQQTQTEKVSQREEDADK